MAYPTASRRALDRWPIIGAGVMIIAGTVLSTGRLLRRMARRRAHGSLAE